MSPRPTTTAPGYAAATLAQHLSPSEPASPPPVSVSVWLTGQTPSRLQRTGRYLPESIAHPAKMLPAIAHQVIETYTAPGQIVFDPMCGIGTTLVEAAHLDRIGLGVEYEPRWAGLARDNLTHARTCGATGPSTVWSADARHLPDDLTRRYTGRVQLILTSPPYGTSNHGRVQAAGRAGHHGQVAKWDHQYGNDPANLGRRSPRKQLAGFTDILTATRPLLAPSAHVAITVRPFRRGGYLTDLPSAVITAGRAAGLIPIERLVVLLARYEHHPDTDGIDDGEQLIAHSSFFQLANIRTARAAGIPQSLIIAEDLLIFAAAPKSFASESCRAHIS
jgi:modification methylase